MLFQLRADLAEHFVGVVLVRLRLGRVWPGWDGLEPVPAAGEMQVELLLAQVVQGGEDYVAVQTGHEHRGDQVVLQDASVLPFAGAEAVEHDRGWRPGCRQ